MHTHPLGILKTLALQEIANLFLRKHMIYSVDHMRCDVLLWLEELVLGLVAEGQRVWHVDANGRHGTAGPHLVVRHLAQSNGTAHTAVQPFLLEHKTHLDIDL